MKELGHQATHQLTRIKASGMFAGHRYKSVWGEYSHHVQNGDYHEASDILDDMVAAVCKRIAETVPQHEIALFEKLAGILADDPQTPGIIYLSTELQEWVAERASWRNLERYSDDYNWYDNL